MKKILFLLFSFFFLFSVEAQELEPLSKNVILYNLDNNEIIYEKSSSDKVRIASLTKIMTSITAIENIDNLDDTVVVQEYMIAGLIEANAKVVGFKSGDVVTYRDLLYGTLLESGADATRILAISLAGSEEEFVKLMNDKAKMLGMNNTNFTNSSGLDTENQYSTVLDVSLVLRYALNNPIFKEAYTTKEYVSSNNIKMFNTLYKTSQEYGIDVNYIVGAKTGYTTKAGYCLSSIATYNGINYLLITTGAYGYEDIPYNIVDSKQIYEYYFENYIYYKVMQKDDVLIYLDNKYSIEDVNILASEDFYYYMFKDDIENIKYEYNGLNEVSIFTKKDEKIGTLNIILDNEIIKSVDIYVPDNIDFSITKFLLKYFYIILIPILMLLLLIYKKIKKVKYAIKKN